MRKEELFDIIGEADEHKVAAAGMAMAAKKMARSVPGKWAALAACLAVVVLIGITLVRTVSVQEPDVTGVSLGNSDLLVVNKLDSLVHSDMDVQFSYYDKLPHDVWMSVSEEFQNGTGIGYEDFTGRIPNTFELNDFYSISARGYKDADLKDEYSLHDYVFDYRTENGGEATIALCSFEAPLRDCYIMCDNPEQSEINGISVVVYGYRNSFMVQFSYKNVNYDIETNGITLEELHALLTGITA